MSVRTLSRIHRNLAPQDRRDSLDTRNHRWPATLCLTSSITQSLGKPFIYDTYLTELTNLRDQLKSKLSANAGHQSNKEEGPTASELTKRIKTLKAANSIEATPQRARQKHSTAEEPVTVRIRRQTGASDVSGTSAITGGVGSSRNATRTSAPVDATTTEQVKPSAHANGQAGAKHELPAKPMTFQERLAKERQHKGNEPILSWIRMTAADIHIYRFIRLMRAERYVLPRAWVERTRDLDSRKLVVASV
jgi:hypothetical protein